MWMDPESTTWVGPESTQRRRQGEERGRDQRDAPPNQEHWAAPGSWKRQEGVSTGVFRGNRVCRHLDIGLLGSRNGREYSFALLSPQFVIIHYKPHSFSKKWLKSHYHSISKYADTLFLMSHRPLLSTGPCTVTCDSIHPPHGNHFQHPLFHSQGNRRSERLGHLLKVTQQESKPRAGLASLQSPSVSHISVALGPCWALVWVPSSGQKTMYPAWSNIHIILEPCSFIPVCTLLGSERNVEQNKNTVEGPAVDMRRMEEMVYDNLLLFLLVANVLSSVFCLLGAFLPLQESHYRKDAAHDNCGCLGILLR